MERLIPNKLTGSVNIKQGVGFIANALLGGNAVIFACAARSLPVTPSVSLATRLAAWLDGLAPGRDPRLYLLSTSRKHILVDLGSSLVAQ